MSSLEELLIKSGAMTEAQLELVRAERDKQGVSLDAAILAQGYLTEEAFQRILGQSFASVPDADFALEPTDKALALLDREHSVSLGVVPQRVLGHDLHVLLRDPAALSAVAELPSVQAFNVVAVGVNDVRLRYLQDRFYGVAREPRYVEIMDRLLARAAEKQAMRESSLDGLIGDPLAGLEPEWMAGAIPMPAEAAPPPAANEADAIPLLDEELLMEVTDEESQWDEDTHEMPLSELHEQLTTENFRSALDAAASMDDLPGVFFRFGVPHFRSVALFKVQSQMVMGWRGAGLGIASELIRGIVVPVQSDTFLARAIENDVFVGIPNGNAVEVQVAEQLGAEEDTHVVTAAVKVAGRPVLVVCGLTEGEDAPPEVVSDFAQLCSQTSDTLKRIIMARKSAKAAEASEDSEASAPKKKKGGKKRSPKKKGS